MKCLNCKEEFEPGFDVCWNCGTDKDGNVAQDFVRPEDQPENTENLVNALNTVGWLTGTFNIQEQRESTPLVKGDFILPQWAVPIVIGVILLAVGWYLQNPAAAWLGVAGIGIGAIMFLFGRLF